MNALLIITIVALQADGSITRQREMKTFTSSAECKAEGTKQAEALAQKEGPPRMFRIECEEMATLEVVRPPQPKKPPEDPKPLPRGRAT